MRILYKPNCYSQQRQREKKAEIYPVLLAMQATYRRNNGDEVYWDQDVKADKVITEPEDLPFRKLPSPDRELTNAIKYQNNGNFKYHPGTYIQVANGCWWGKCSFCVEKENAYEVRNIESVIQELKEIKSQGFREVFDDSGTFPIGKFLEDFCRKAPIGLTYGCNMRMVNVDYKDMKQAGFRMVLFGLESANQRTLDRINKGTSIDDVKWIIKASKAGLEPHISSMVGFPFETEKETIKTVNLVKWLLIKGYAKTAQMSFYTPPLNQEQGKEEYRKYVGKHYDVAFNPQFWYNKIIDIKSIEDFQYLLKGIKEGINAKANNFNKFKMQFLRKRF